MFLFNRYQKQNGKKKTLEKSLLFSFCSLNENSIVEHEVTHVYYHTIGLEVMKYVSLL